MTINNEQENIFQEFWLQGHDRDWNGHVGSVDIHKMADEIIKLRAYNNILSLVVAAAEGWYFGRTDDLDSVVALKDAIKEYRNAN
jgi:hypothetical protein